MPAIQEAPPVLSSRTGLVTPFEMPDRKNHEPNIFPEAPLKNDDSDAGFDEFGGWLV